MCLIFFLLVSPRSAAPPLLRLCHSHSFASTQPWATWNYLSNSLITFLTDQSILLLPSQTLLDARLPVGCVIEVFAPHRFSWAPSIIHYPLPPSGGLRNRWTAPNGVIDRQHMILYRVRVQGYPICLPVCTLVNTGVHIEGQLFVLLQGVCNTTNPFMWATFVRAARVTSE